MTDVSDLRRRLGELADETPEVSPKQLLAATRHRIRVHHRVRVTGAVGAVALLLAVGPTVSEAFTNLFWLERACKAQVAAMACNARVVLPELSGP